MGMVMYAYEFKTKGKQKLTYIKKTTRFKGIQKKC